MRVPGARSIERTLIVHRRHADQSLRIQSRTVQLRIQRHATGRFGFTLLETVLAVALSAVLIALIAAGMRIYATTVSQSRSEVVNARVARVILQRIANDLKSSYTTAADEEPSSDIGLGADSLAGDSLAGDSDAGDALAGDSLIDDSFADTTGEESIDSTSDLANSTVQQAPGIYGNSFELQVDVLGRFAEPVRYDMLVAASGDPLASNLLSEPKVVTYYVRTASSTELAGTPLESVESNSRESMSILARRVQTRAVAVNSSGLGLGDTQSGEQLLSDQVASIQFEYHDGFEWTDTWDSSATGLPVAVKITLTVLDPADDNTDTLVIDSSNTFEMTVRIPTADVITSATASEL